MGAGWAVVGVQRRRLLWIELDAAARTEAGGLRVPGVALGAKEGALAAIVYDLGRAVAALRGVGLDRGSAGAAPGDQRIHRRVPGECHGDSAGATEFGTVVFGDVELGVASGASNELQPRPPSSACSILLNRR